MYTYIHTYTYGFTDQSRSTWNGNALNNIHVNGQWMPEVKIRPDMYIHTYIQNNIHIIHIYIYTYIKQTTNQFTKKKKQLHIYIHR